MRYPTVQSSLPRPLRRLATGVVERSRPSITVVGSLFLLVGLLSGSGLQPAGAAGTAKYPVTITNCGDPLTFDRAPRHVVVNTVGILDLLALGLGHTITSADVTGDVPVGQPPVPDKYLRAFRKIPHIVKKTYSVETLVGLHPDLYLSGYGYGLEPGTTLTPAGLAGYGINVVALQESCVHVNPTEHQFSLASTYGDLTNLGRIFGVESRAKKVIAHMKSTIKAVKTKVAHLEPVSVFDYDSGTDSPITSGALATPNTLLKLAGGTNIFRPLKQGWTTVTWEAVVAAKPQCILINDYGTPTAKQKISFLRHDPVAKTLPAVRHGCFLAIPYNEITPTPLDADGVVALAHWLHPKAFR